MTLGELWTKLTGRQRIERRRVDDLRYARELGYWRDRCAELEAEVAQLRARVYRG